MRWRLFLLTCVMSYPMGELVAVPSHCPKIDQTMLKADQDKLGMGGELELNNYRWRVSGGNLCIPNCGSEYQQALQDGIKIESKHKIIKPHGVATCYYGFTRDGITVANLVLTTDDSLKLPEHSFKRWSDVTTNVEKVMEKEEEKYRDDPRIRME